MTVTYQVRADICYLDGPLAGINIPAGYNIKYPANGLREAWAVMRWLEKVRRENDFIRATGTGHRYKVVSAADLVPLAVAA